MDSSPPRSSLAPPRRAPWIVVALLAVGIGAAVALWPRHRAPAPAPPGAGEVAAVDAGALPDGGVTAPDPARGRASLESASRGPLFRQGISGEDRVRRWAVVLDNLAEGDSPRGELAFLAPTQPFGVESRGGRTYIAPGSYARYDAFAKEVGAIDATAVASAYRDLRPALETAYRALGYPDAALDDALARALRRLVDAPVVDGPVEVVGEGNSWSFADASLEEEGDVEKHLLRMGPANARVVRAKARELLHALALDAPR